MLCGYAIESFDDDANADPLRTICRQHTHVIPAEGFTDAPDDRTRLEHVALLQQRARALDRVLAREPPAPAEASAVTASTVYVIDDDASVRRSLARLLASVDLQVQTFASAEAFLAEVDQTSSGCLLLDVQLVGMSGPDLQSRWRRALAHAPHRDERLARRSDRAGCAASGASAFLRKPFDAQALIDAIARALS